jgi:hypothetical protein
MNKKNISILLLGVVGFILLIELLKIAIFEPWLKRKLEGELIGRISNSQIRIEKVQIFLMSCGIELKNISVNSINRQLGDIDLNGDITSIKFKGIHIVKAILTPDIHINSITVSNSIIKGKNAFAGKVLPPIIASFNIRIESLTIDNMEMVIENYSSAQIYSVKEGFLRVLNLNIEKKDTISPGLINQFDFKAEKLFSISADSMYSFMANRITYSSDSGILLLNSFSIQPNFKNYDFTSRNEFRSDRIEACIKNIVIHGFSAPEYLISGGIISSYAEFGKTDLNVFRDNRKKNRHVKKAVFQEMIYHYPAAIRIDSIGLNNWNVSYTEHAENANEAGNIVFNKINARIYKMTNDTIYKTESAFLILKAEALLMGKGKTAISLKSRLFDPQNTFSLSGTLSDFQVMELNPILEKNAFIYVTSGKIDEMKFSLTANNVKSSGKMTILYNGLDIAIKNKKTDDTTAFKERFVSVIANKKVLNSNPIPGKEVRYGIISYNRDPERFFLNYCSKSILSGVKSSIIKSPKKKKK